MENMPTNKTYNIDQLEEAFENHTDDLSTDDKMVVDDFLGFLRDLVEDVEKEECPACLYLDEPCDNCSDA